MIFRMTHSVPNRSSEHMNCLPQNYDFIRHSLVFVTGYTFQRTKMAFAFCLKYTVWNLAQSLKQHVQIIVECVAKSYKSSCPAFFNLF